MKQSKCYEFSNYEDLLLFYFLMQQRNVSQIHPILRLIIEKETNAYRNSMIFIRVNFNLVPKTLVQLERYNPNYQLFHTIVLQLFECSIYAKAALKSFKEKKSTLEKKRWRELQKALVQDAKECRNIRNMFKM